MSILKVCVRVCVIKSERDQCFSTEKHMLEVMSTFKLG